MTTAGNDTCGTGEDQLLARQYQQVAVAAAARYAATYDADAGLKRFQDWLREHTAAEDQFGGSAADTGLAPPFSMPARPGLDANRADTELHSMHYKSLVRLADLLVRDAPTAEEVVQDAFIAMHDGWHRLQDAENALAYLRQAVVNRSRLVLRHQKVADKTVQQPPPDTPSAEHHVLAMLDRSAVQAALRELPDRQREAIMLRYYGDLSEAEIAAAMSISRGAVKSHTARGMATLRAAMEDESK